MLFRSCGGNRKAAASVSAATVTGPSAVEPSAAGRPIVIVARDDRFSAPSRLPSGNVEIMFKNAGREHHELTIARLNDGVTLDEAFQQVDPSAVVSDLQQTEAAPGQSSVLSAELRPGTWAIVDFLPSSDGQPNATKGMVGTFSVN